MSEGASQVPKQVGVNGWLTEDLKEKCDGVVLFKPK